MTELLCLAGALAFAIGCTVYDVTMSEKGLKAGVAVEANYTWLYGTKPTALQYYAVFIPIVLATAGVSVAGHYLGNIGLFYGGLAAPIAVGIQHIVGGLEWRALGVKF
jgi:hypothetical protein